MDDLKLVKHAPGAPGLRLFGLGPDLSPHKGIEQIIELLNENTFWAQGRKKKDIRKMLSKSDVVITFWKNRKLIGFGRATSDGVFRATLWDIVIDQNYQTLGLGRNIIKLILENPLIIRAERVYLMTTHCEDFYINMGFQKECNQTLMRLQN